MLTSLLFLKIASMQKSFYRIITLLLKEGRVHSDGPQDSMMETPLSIAVRKNDLHVAEMLLKAGAVGSRVPRYVAGQNFRLYLDLSPMLGQFYSRSLAYTPSIYEQQLIPDYVKCVSKISKKSPSG